MSLAFEAAVISIAIGAVLSVVLQGRLHDGDRGNVPPRVDFVLRVVDIWLATMFLLVVAVVIAVALDAMAKGAPLKPIDRRGCEHLLGLAAIYPALTALTRRTLPILFASPEAAYASPRIQLAVLILPVLALVLAAGLLPVLLDPKGALDTQWLLIGLVGAIAVAPCVAIPEVSGWWGRRTLRRVRQEARRLGWAEQHAIGVLPYVEEEVTVRLFVSSRDGDTVGCWMDYREAERLVRHIGEARRAVRRQGEEPPDREKWWVVTFGPRRHLLVKRLDGGEADERRWRPQYKYFFEAGALSTRLRFRMPVERGATSNAASA